MLSGAQNFLSCAPGSTLYLLVLPQQVESILGSIYVYRVHDYVEQIAVVASLEQFLDEHPKVTLVISLFVPQNVSFLSRDEQGVPGLAWMMVWGARCAESESHR